MNAHIIHRRSVGSAIAIALIGAAVAFAILSRGAGANGGRWTWKTGVPGTAVTRDASLDQMLAASPGIDAGSLKAVAAIGSGEYHHQLLAATNSAGVPCFADRGETFLCLDRRYDPYAVVVFPRVGGSAYNVVDQASLIGIARSDVAKVTLSLEDGGVSELALDSSRSFEYATNDAGAVPTSLHAYDADGLELQTVELASAPLSSSPTQLRAASSP